MAYKVFEDYKSYNEQNESDNGNTVLQSNGDTLINLPDASFVKDADLSRDGFDLVLELNGETITIEGYFLSEPAPNLVAPDGTTLTPDLVESFTQGGNEYANASISQNDASPIGAIQEISGDVTVIRTDGTEQGVSIGTPIFQGDVIETSENGAVNIMFVDETTFAVSEDARLAIDEYVFDASTQSGSSNFSVLKGVFVFTSGLIGRENPDDVTIDTPSGSIGIRGTIIAGNLNTGEITVIEGAIVLTDFAGNSITLSNQFETARFNPSESTIEHLGDLSAEDVAAKFSSVSTVAADTFSSVQDVRSEKQINNDNTQETQSDTSEGQDANSDTDTENATETQESAPEENTGEETGEATEMIEETIMSDDIMESQSQTEATTQNNTSQNTNANTSSNASSNTQDDTPQDDIVFEDPAPQDPPPQDPTFEITVTPFAFSENDNGTPAVARVTGNLASISDLELNGVSQNFFDVVRESANSFLISVAAGEEIDFEAPKPLDITATSGAESVVQAISLDISDINESVTGTAASGTTGEDNTFRTGMDRTFIHDFSQEFDDPEGEIIGYNLLTDIGGPNTSAPMIDGSGLFTFETDSATDTGFNFTIQAVTATGTIDLAEQTFEVLSPNFNPPNITVDEAIFEGNAANITILAGEVTVFATNPGTGNTIRVLAEEAYVKAGVNDDTIEVSSGSEEYRIYGDTGNDRFELSELEEGWSFGGIGDDTFILETAGTLSQLEENDTETLINGDGGFDVLGLGTSNGGNIDFSNVDGDYINDIEALAFQNGQANVIDLDYNTVIDITDDDNTLFVTLDNTDTLDFDNTSGHVFIQTGTTSRDGENFNIFTDGEITLMVDTDVTPTGIV